MEAMATLHSAVGSRFILMNRYCRASAKSRPFRLSAAKTDNYIEVRITSSNTRSVYDRTTVSSRTTPPQARVRVSYCFFILHHYYALLYAHRVDYTYTSICFLSFCATNVLVTYRYRYRKDKRRSQNWLTHGKWDFRVGPTHGRKPILISYRVTHRTNKVYLGYHKWRNEGQS